MANTPWGAIAGAAGSIVGGLFTAKAAKRARESQEYQARLAREDKQQMQSELKTLEAQRQEIINPYEGVSDLSGIIQDTSQSLSNAYESLGVATQAAEFQAEEADISLANTLDLLASTGASAGGATALAQAALQSKRGISANIQQQEAQNARARAEGDAMLQQQKQAEQIRLQSARYTEAGRLQSADVAGREFVFGQRERREGEQLNRVQAQITNQAQAEQAYNTSAGEIAMAGTTAVGNIIGQGISTIGAGIDNFQAQKALQTNYLDSGYSNYNTQQNTRGQIQTVNTLPSSQVQTTQTLP